MIALAGLPRTGQRQLPPPLPGRPTKQAIFPRVALRFTRGDIPRAPLGLKSMPPMMSRMMSRTLVWPNGGDLVVSPRWID